jgi:hypothetical protein
VIRAVRSLLPRPDLWPTAVRQLFRMTRPGAWRRPPFLPRPDPAYARFRSVTMYGDADRAVDGRDLVTYLEWCRAIEPHLEP